MNLTKRICKSCNNEFYIKTWRLKEKGRGSFCSKICFYSFNKGVNNPSYKGGHLHKDGYWVISLNGKNKLLHRHIMEQKLGRKLTLKEHVHHKNKNRLDNRLENLEVLSPYEHGVLHGKFSIRKKPVTNKSGIAGVYLRKDNGLWSASITVNKKRCYLGCFKNKNDAIKARKWAEEQRHEEARKFSNQH